jgi:hypothetical protein
MAREEGRERGCRRVAVARWRRRVCVRKRVVRMPVRCYARVGQLADVHLCARVELVPAVVVRD